ncbi:uncharacterized protein LOC121590046 [Anopheles merus]|uniref:uncharacterized protein LOC121590046 n=1 Tax=Anopheles merus TaxID=30066 RepID=UPI001BE4957A|nr:uncharacterized protein LOC121590046 [Anopheles merus]
MMSQAAEGSDTGNGVPSSPMVRCVAESSATPWRPMTFPDLCGFPAAQQLYGLPVPIDLSFLRSPVSGDEEASGQSQQQQHVDLPSLKMMSQAAEGSDTGNGVPSSPMVRCVAESSATPWRPMTFPDLCGFPAAQQLYGLPVPIDLSFLRSPVSGDEEASGQSQQQQHVDLPSLVFLPTFRVSTFGGVSGAPRELPEWNDVMVPASSTAQDTPIILQQFINEEANMAAFNDAAQIADSHENTDQPDQQPSVASSMIVEPIGRAGLFGSLYAVWYAQLGSDITERIPDCVLYDPELPPEHQEPPPILTSLLMCQKTSTGDLVTIPYGQNPFCTCLYPYWRKWPKFKDQ